MPIDWNDELTQIDANGLAAKSQNSCLFVSIRGSNTLQAGLRVNFADFDDSSDFIVVLMPIVTSGHSGRLEFTTNRSCFDGPQVDTKFNSGLQFRLVSDVGWDVLRHRWAETQS